MENGKVRTRSDAQIIYDTFYTVEKLIRLVGSRGWNLENLDFFVEIVMKLVGTLHRR